MAVAAIVIAGTVGTAINAIPQGGDTITYFNLMVPWTDRDGSLGEPTSIQCFTKQQFQQQLTIGANVIVSGNMKVVKPEGKSPYIRIDFSYGSVDLAGMATSVNMVAIAGNIGQEPESRFTQNNKAMLKHSLAVKTGQDTTDWYNIIFWGRTAENGQKCLHKGSKITVLGELTQERWTNKEDGSPRSKFMIRGTQFALQGGGNGNGNNQNAATQTAAAPTPNYSQDAF